MSKKAQEVLDKFREKLWENLNEKDAIEVDQFAFIDWGYGEAVEWNEFTIYCSENSDRGWNDETDDYERDEREQMLYELQTLKENIDMLLDTLYLEEN